MGELDPKVREKVEKLFYDSGFLKELGIRLKTAGKGWCETALDVSGKHMQQDGFVHAGVQATMADHTAGGAARTMVEGDSKILTIEFKINYLRPATGSTLRCRGTILKPGRTIMVAESELFSGDGSGEKLAAKATVTLAVVRG